MLGTVTWELGVGSIISQYTNGLVMYLYHCLSGSIDIYDETDAEYPANKTKRDRDDIVHKSDTSEGIVTMNII